MILTDHKAIISALKTNRGNKTYQSRLTRWADRLLPFDFDIFHISGCKLEIVDYLSRFPTFEAPRPSSFDEQYVVKCISRFFDACEFLDGWARHYTSTEELSDTPEVCQDYAVPDQINLVELLGNCQSRINCPRYQQFTCCIEQIWKHTGRGRLNSKDSIYIERFISARGRQNVSH